jgi:hypothetical protein
MDGTGRVHEHEGMGNAEHEGWCTQIDGVEWKWDILLFLCPYYFVTLHQWYDDFRHQLYLSLVDVITPAHKH